jgi:hypothetical protein
MDRGEAAWYSNGLRQRRLARFTPANPGSDNNEQADLHSGKLPYHC